VGKKKTKKPTIHVTTSLGLFYVKVEHNGEELDVIGPFKSLAEANNEQAKQKKLRKKTA
jgi:hypothetical protein